MAHDLPANHSTSKKVNREKAISPFSPDDSQASHNTTPPLISVITVVFNDADYLERTIRSVTEQRYGNVEYIVIDGGSTDGTLDIIQQFGAQIDYWVSEPDRGLYEAMNKAIGVASGDWLNFMNAGDTYTDAQALSETMRHTATGVDAVYSDHYRYSSLDSTGVKISCDASKLKILHQSLVYRRSLHEAHGPYLVHPNISISDYLFFSLLNPENFVKSPHPISRNLTGGISDKQEHIRQKLAVDYFFGKLSILTMSTELIRDYLNRALLALRDGS